MSKAFANIEKLCLDALHNGNKDVCCFTKNERRYISDSYAIWEFSYGYELGECYVKYPENKELEEKLYNLVEKYKERQVLFPLQSSGDSVITRGYTATKYENWNTASEAWLQDKYIVLFEPFSPEFCVYPDWEESKPIIVNAGSLFGLIMPMHITEEIKAMKDQRTLL